jgi:hypothetical protein
MQLSRQFRGSPKLRQSKSSCNIGGPDFELPTMLPLNIIEFLAP